MNAEGGASSGGGGGGSASAGGSAGASGGGNGGSSGGGSDAGDGGTDTSGDDAGDGSTGSSTDEGASAAGAKKPSKAAPGKNGKYKIKRGGAEAEFDVDTLVSMHSDDYEHEIAFGDTDKRKLKWPDIVRHVQKSGGAEELMRQAAAQRKQLSEQVEYGKKNPEWVLEHLLGIGDHREFAKQVILKQMQEETELDELAKSNPGEYHKRMEARAAAALERKNGFEASRTKREAEGKAAKERSAKIEGEARDGLKGAGVPANGYTMQLVAQAFRKQRELGFTPPDPLGHAVAEAAHQYRTEMFSMLDSAGDDSVLELLGKERRKRLRALELAHAEGRGGGRKPAETDDEEIPGARRNGSGKKTISEAEFLRSRGGSSSVI
jgi:hypothetical protein